MVYFLLVLALAALAFELTQPGFGFAGFAGLGMLALGLYGLTVVPVNWVGLALLVGGIGLMVLDVRARRLGPLTAVGLVAFAVGSVLAWSGMASPMRISPWLIGEMRMGDAIPLQASTDPPRTPPVLSPSAGRASGRGRRAP